MRNDEKLGTAPLGRLMLSLALPTVLAQLINVLYNVVDRIYIGHMQGDGNLALTGVGVTLPIITLIAAFSAFAGAGGAPLAAIELGKKDERKASLIMGNSAWLLVFFSIVLTIGFLIFKVPVLYAFGASSKTIAYANEYITIYLLGTIFVQLALGLNAFISGQGAAKAAMLSVLIGAVINIVLDPIFIFALHLGVRGAALATVISQFVSAVWVVSFLKSKRSVLYLKLVRPDKSLILKIAALGIAPFVMQSTEKLGDDHFQYRPSALRRRPLRRFDVDSDEHHAIDRHSGQRHYSRRPADRQLQLRCRKQAARERNGDSPGFRVLAGNAHLGGRCDFLSEHLCFNVYERCRTCCFDMPNHADFFLGHCDFRDSGGLSIDVSRIGTGEGFAFYRHAAENHPADSVGTHLAKIFGREMHLHCRTGF